MKYISKELIDWGVREIETKYPDDISLLIGHTHWKIEPDGDEVAFNFFVPNNEKGYGLAQTFIIDDIGYDLFPMSWDRVEGLSKLDESLTTCLGEGVVLYARTDEDRSRFIELQKKLADHLNDPEYVYNKGLEKLQTAMEIYKTMIFESSLAKVRKASGFIANYLAQGIAMMNGTYFKRGPENQIDVLNQMKEVPKEFTEIYLKIIEAKTLEASKNQTFRLLEVTRDFFSVKKESQHKQSSEYDYEALAGWYEEGVYTFRRIDYYSEQNDIINAFAWGYSMQQEFDAIEEEFGLEAMDLMSTFDSEDLNKFRTKALAIKSYIEEVLVSKGVVIKSYKSLDEFLKADR